jgi:hypothetical protein
MKKFTTLMKAKTSFKSVALTCTIVLAPLGEAAYAQVCNVAAPCNENVSSAHPTISLINSGAGIGVLGQSNKGTGVQGEGTTGVQGEGTTGVRGTGTVRGVVGTTTNPSADAVVGEALAPTGIGSGVMGRSKSPHGIGVQGIGTTGVLGVGGRRNDGVQGRNENLDGAAGTFLKGQPGRPDTLAALQVRNTMPGGEAAWLQTTNAENQAGVLKLLLPTNSRSSFLECHRPDGTRKCQINSAGTFISGRDFAEALPAKDYELGYEPGDVLVMARDGSGVEKTSEPYSRRIVGVFSTHPAVLGVGKNGDTRMDPEDVPVAILGIVPTKVSTENGAIEVGDLLVTAATSGHAMKGIDPTRMFGAVVGKALKPLVSETGVIPVLVAQ